MDRQAMEAALSQHHMSILGQTEGQTGLDFTARPLSLPHWVLPPPGGFQESTKDQGARIHTQGASALGRGHLRQPAPPPQSPEPPAGALLPACLQKGTVRGGWISRVPSAPAAKPWASGAPLWPSHALFPVASLLDCWEGLAGPQSLVKMSQAPPPSLPSFPPSSLPLHKGLPCHLPSHPISALCSWRPCSQNRWKDWGSFSHSRTQTGLPIAHACFQLWVAMQTRALARGAWVGRQDWALPPIRAHSGPGFRAPTWTHPSPRPDFLLWMECNAISI